MIYRIGIQPHLHDECFFFVHKEPFVHGLVYYQRYNRSMNVSSLGDSENILLVASELNDNAMNCVREISL